jgi:DNA primase
MRHNGMALVVEGYFDVLALHRAGFTNAVATCGTALTSDHARLLKRYAEKVLLIFDQDAAGRQATFRAMDALLPSGLAVNVIAMPAGEDPDSLLKNAGEEGFRRCLEAARPVLEVFIEDQLNVHDDTVEGRARAANQVLDRIRRLPDDLERSLYLQRLAGLIGLNVEELKAKLRGGIAPETTAGRPRPVRTEAAKQPVDAGQTQKYLLRLMLIDARLRQRVRDEGVDELFLDADYRSLAAHLLQREAPDGNLPDDLLDETLPQDQQSLLAGLVLQEDSGWASDPEKIFEDCRRAARTVKLKGRLAEVSRLLAEARQNQDDEAEMTYLREYAELNQKIKKKF